MTPQQQSALAAADAAVVALTEAHRVLRASLTEQPPVEPPVDPPPVDPVPGEWHVERVNLTRLMFFDDWHKGGSDISSARMAQLGGVLDGVAGGGFYQCVYTEPPPHLAAEFIALRAELAGFAGRMEDLERRAWDLSRRWLSMQGAPAVQWTRDYNLADIEQELRILAEMQAAGMPAAVIAEQQRRIVAVQFGGLEQDRAAQINQAIDEREHEPRVTPNPQPAGAVS